MNFDLRFWSGITKNTIYNIKDIQNYLLSGQNCYPVPVFESGAYDTLDASDPYIISYKIYNNNLVTPTPYEALYIYVKPTNIDNTLIIDTKIAYEGVGSSETYGFVDFSVTYEGEDTEGDFLATTAFAIDTDYSSKFGVGFPGALGTYTWGEPPTEDMYLSLDLNEAIIGIAIPTNNQIIRYIITENNLYRVSIDGSINQQLDTIGFSELTSIAYVTPLSETGDVILVTGRKNGRYRYFFYVQATDTYVEHDSPFSNDIKINKVVAKPFSGMVNHVCLCSEGEGIALRDITDLTDNTWFLYNTTGEDIKGQTSTVLSGLQSDNIRSFDRVPSNVISADIYVTGLIVVGLDIGSQVGIYRDTPFLMSLNNSGIPTLSVLLPDTILHEGSNSNDVAISYSGEIRESSLGIPQTLLGSYSIVSAISSGFYAFTAANTTGGPQGQDFENFTYETLSSALRVAGTGEINNTDAYWLGSTAGNGIYTAQRYKFFVDDNTNTFEQITYNYESVVKDITKSDVHIYYYLIQLRGSSDLDSSTVLLRYNYETEDLSYGEVGAIPTDKLWVAGNAFILRNIEDKNTFFYKTTETLDLDDLSPVEGSAGLVFTTFAGEIVDIIYDRDLFYILGTRGFEVWQNQGAANFPYRKVQYLSIPFHLFPLASESDYPFPVRRWANYRDGYVTFVLANRSASMRFLYLNNGRYKILPIDEVKIQSALTFTNTEITDFTIDVVNLWEKDYILLGVLSVDTLLFYVVISPEGNVSRLSGELSGVYTSLLHSTSSNGIKLQYNNTNKIITTFTAENYPTSVSTQDNNYVAISDVCFTDKSENVEQITLILRYLYISQEIDIPDDAFYLIEKSYDEGRTYIPANPESKWNLEQRALIIRVASTAPSIVIKITSNYPVIINSAILTFTLSGRK